MAARKSKRTLWELMLQLEESGEEDVCSLLNQLMGAQPYFGSGTDLAEYLEALTALEAQGELCCASDRGDGASEGQAGSSSMRSALTRSILPLAVAFDTAVALSRGQ